LENHCPFGKDKNQEGGGVYLSPLTNSEGGVVGKRVSSGKKGKREALRGGKSLPQTRILLPVEKEEVKKLFPWGRRRQVEGVP